jgi:hypothetical protein
MVNKLCGVLCAGKSGGVRAGVDMAPRRGPATTALPLSLCAGRAHEVLKQAAKSPHSSRFNAQTWVNPK